MSKYAHSCSACRYLGTSINRELARRAGSQPDYLFDFYICEPGNCAQRSFIARFGDADHEYTSGPLFCCAELTVLDKIALVNGLPLLPDEEQRLHRLALRLLKDSFTRVDLDRLAVKCSFGSGNLFFPGD